MENRLERITRASSLGIGLNFLLVAVKAVVGVITGSVSISADAVNNLTDSMSAIVTLVGTRLAQKKPDKIHPHGHGRIEYLAAAVVGLIILGVGVSVGIESVPKIIKPVMASYPIWTTIVIFTTVIAKLGFGRYLKKVGKETKSRSLEGAGMDAMFDAALSFGTLVGAGVNLAFGVSIDGWIGLLIALFIVRSAFEIISEGITDIIGRKVDGGLMRRIRDTIREEKDVESVVKLILHDYGPEDISGVVRVKVKDEMKMKEFRELSERIERRVETEFGVKLVVGV